MEQFIYHNGYVTVFLTVAFAGEFGLFTGVALARTGAVSLTGVVILGTVASFVGNMLYYYAGRLLWKKWRFLRMRFEEKIERTSRVVRRYGSPIMLIARFFYGIRNVIAIALGVYDVRAGIFVIYNLVGAFIWSWFFTEAGSVFSSYFMNTFASFRAGMYWGILSSIFVAALFVLIRKAISRLQK
ncbi:MAG TPA: DedA family protein [Candidatus Kryptonia bacterium]